MTENLKKCQGNWKGNDPKCGRCELENGCYERTMNSWGQRNTAKDD